MGTTAALSNSATRSEKLSIITTIFKHLVAAFRGKPESKKSRGPAFAGMTVRVYALGTEANFSHERFPL